MSEPARFHLDESADFRIAAGLRRRDRDCSTTQEVGLIAASDEQQFAYAQAERRVLVTRDHDFLEIAMNAEHHAGLVICKRRTHFGMIIKQLDQMASDKSATEFHDQIFYL